MNVPKPGRAPVTTLADDDRGTFCLFTEASSYQISLTEAGHTLTRMPGAGLGEMPGVPGNLAPVADLRQDDHPLELLRIEECVVGQRAILWLLMPDGGVVPEGYQGTRRETTIVRAIQRVDEGDDL